MGEAINNFDYLSPYRCGFCEARLPLSDLIRHLTNQHTNRLHQHFLWCKLCSPLPRDIQQPGNRFQSGMRKVSDRTHLPAGVYYNPSTNFLCATNEWHNDAYYGYSNTPTNEYIPTVPMYGYANATGVLQLSNMQGNFNGIPFQATAHVNYHLPMLNYEAPHANIVYAGSPLEAMNNEVQRVEGERPNFEGAESQSEVTNGEIPTKGSPCAESQSEVTNGEIPTKGSPCAESQSEVTNGEIPTKGSPCAESQSEVTNGEIPTKGSPCAESQSDVTNGEMQIIYSACIESPSEATKQELPHTNDTTTCAESPSEATNEKIPIAIDSAHSELRSDATNEISCIEVVTNIVSRSVASNDGPHVGNATYVEPQTVVVKPEIVSKYKDDSHVVAGLNEIRFSESNTAFQRNPNSNLPRMRTSSINCEDSNYNHFRVSTNNSRQDQRGRDLNVYSNTDRNSSDNIRNGYRNGHRGENSDNFNNTRGRGDYQNRNDPISPRNHNSRRSGNRSTEYNGSDNLNQRNKYNNFENRSNQRNGRSNRDSSTVANKSRGGDRNNEGLNGSHCYGNEQNSRIRENVKITNASSGTSKRSYSEVVKRRLQTR